jgi:hypothetical protein
VVAGSIPAAGVKQPFCQSFYQNHLLTAIIVLRKSCTKSHDEPLQKPHSIVSEDEQFHACMSFFYAITVGSMLFVRVGVHDNDDTEKEVTVSSF